MTELERYISENRDSFDSEPVPAGSREKFMAAVAHEKRRRRIRTFSFAFTGMAAALSAIMVLFSEPDLAKELERHHRRLAEKGNEIMVRAEKEHPTENEMIISAIRSITYEAIPLEEQLPDILPQKEKIRILNDYYDQKYSALESLMAEL